MIDVYPLDASGEAAYDAFVRSHPDGLLHYSLAYRRLLQSLVPGTPAYYVAWREGQVCGVLPTFALDGPLGTVVNTLPYYGSHGGPLAADAAAARALAATYAEIVTAPGVAAATLVENPLAPLAVDVPHDATDTRIGQFTPLPVGPDAAERLSASFHYKTRNMIRKAEKEGVTVREDAGAFDFLRAVHTENMRAKGATPKSAHFFQAVARCFQPGVEYRLYVADREGEPVAAMLLFFFEGVVEYFMPAIRLSHRSAQPLSLLIYTAMVEAATRGYTLWNWGGSWVSQKSLHRFKKRWGTKDVLYTYRVKVNDVRIWEATPAALLEAYPNYFVAPFHLLESASEEAAL